MSSLRRRPQGEALGGDALSLLTPLSGEKSGNAQFTKEVVAWTFQENLVLRVDTISHHKLGESEAPEVYTTNDQIVSVPP